VEKIFLIPRRGGYSAWPLTQSFDPKSPPLEFMLGKEERQNIEKAIKDKKAELEIKIEEYKELTKPIPPENAIGRVSRMDAINNKSVNEAALRQAENTLIKLDLALLKIDEPHFGLCTGCGKSIPIGRVMLMPQSTRCVQCAS
jgi:DnaK suppressor protein